MFFWAIYATVAIVEWAWLGYQLNEVRQAEKRRSEAHQTRQDEWL